MGKHNKENVQLVVSHVEGCSGNFFGRLVANLVSYPQEVFRVDKDLNPDVLAINGRHTWYKEIDENLENHKIVVTHNFNQSLIKNTFPNARLIAFYPYTHVGNALYNICYKKLTIKLQNQVDNHFIHLTEWHKKIIGYEPEYRCHDFWMLTDVAAVEQLIGTQLSAQQRDFFNNYWNHQMTLDLEIPNEPMQIKNLLDFWKINSLFDDWLVALVIYTYEYINDLDEKHRLWSINDADKFSSWQDVIDIGDRYLIT